MPAQPGVRDWLGFPALSSGTGLLLLAVGLCWVLFFCELRGEWAVNAQYNYGYGVPLLGLALIWRRWPDRPVSSPSSKNKEFLNGLIAAGLLFLVLPFQAVLEANPEWRLLYWLNGFQVVGITFCLLYQLGGWTWARFFAPSLLFMLIAIPWPMEMETAVIQGLMRQVAGWTVEVAGWLGIPAVQHGNLVEVGAGLVGIDEACSGVRSLQSALMLSLFLGEMYRFSWLRRGGLLAASLLFVLVANLTRTTFLVWAAATRGIVQMQAWHDTAGILVMCVVLPCLMGLAYVMKPRVPAPVSGAAPSPPQAPAILPVLPRWAGIAALAWLVFAQLATEVWYRTHESDLIPNARWSVAWPAQSPRFRKTAVPENSLAILRCSNSDAATWQDDEGELWSAFLLRWNPGKNSEQLAKGHRPEICFPAAGARLVQDFGQTNLDAGGVVLPFRHESFESGANILHVFYCLWSDKRAPHEPRLAEDGSRSSRLEAVLAGKRNLGQQVLEIVIQGPDSSDEAVSTLKQQLPSLVRRL
ncbi:MAG TPA: exosortase/archaeosortase family protein [Candidatus Cybelea sp.]|jgi:exosortase|nr:exosortase/archaeosortase family protein [Candidatus Cybelea sp.]